MKVELEVKDEEMLRMGLSVRQSKEFAQYILDKFCNESNLDGEAVDKIMNLKENYETV